MMHIFTTNTGYCLKGNKDINRNLMVQSRSHVASNEFHGDFVFTSPQVEEDNTIVSHITDLFENYNEDHPYCSDDIKLSYGSTL